MKVFIAIVVLAGLAAGGCESKAPTFKTVAVRRGEILATIGATGTLEPQEIVDVGAQVAGMIDRFGADPDRAGMVVDYDSRVTKGMLLAHIDDTTYQADLETANAQESQAEASVDLARASLIQADAKLREAGRDWDRAQKLGPSEALSENDYDMYQANFEVAKAAKKVVEATIVQNEKQVIQAKSTIKKAQRNMEFCTINSPVDGVIISRRVNIGQTVVSSLSAPSLFLIAQDMHRLVVWVAVNEADIGNIHDGQAATFSVDAHPGETFSGEVTRVRYEPQVTQNVVTYIVEVLVDNANLELRPYQTANLQFQVSKHENALLVPNAALRWQPNVNEIAPEFRDTKVHDAESESAEKKSESHAASHPTTGPATQQARTAHGTVWVKSGTNVRPIHVRVGVTDGTDSEIFGSEVTPETEVIINETRPESHGMFGGH